MPTTTTYRLSRSGWIVDPTHTPRDLGAQIEWSECDPERVDAQGKKYVPDGTLMARMASGKVVPRVDVLLEAIEGYDGDLTGDETAVGFLIGQANEGDKHDALTGYGLLLGGLLYENLLPDSGHEDWGDWKAELAAEASVVGFAFATHTNSIAE